MEQKTFKRGDPVTAEFMTKLTQTVATAESNAAKAEVNAAKAEVNAAEAKVSATAAKEAAEALTGKADRREFDGKSIHIRFSANASGSNSSETWQSGMNYIGIAVSAAETVPLSAYKWIKFVGEKGADFSLDGKTLHITVK